jgi:hypothetical protein
MLASAMNDFVDKSKRGIPFPRTLNFSSTRNIEMRIQQAMGSIRTFVGAARGIEIKNRNTVRQWPESISTDVC